MVLTMRDTIRFYSKLAIKNYDSFGNKDEGHVHQNLKEEINLVDVLI